MLTYHVPAYIVHVHLVSHIVLQSAGCFNPLGDFMALRLQARRDLLTGSLKSTI